MTYVPVREKTEEPDPPADDVIDAELVDGAADDADDELAELAQQGAGEESNQGDSHDGGMPQGGTVLTFLGAKYHTGIEATYTVGSRVWFRIEAEITESGGVKKMANGAMVHVVKARVEHATPDAE